MIEIDPEQCIRCNKCLSVCGTQLLKINPETKLPYLAYEYCSGCGHCVAVCESNAINLKEYRLKNLEPTPDNPIPFENFLKLSKRRRSYRNFIKKPIPQSILKKILTSTKYIPTGCNEQEIQYTVITDTQVIARIASKMHKVFSILAWLTNLFFMKPLLRLFMGQADAQRAIVGTKRLVDSYRNGKDLYLRNPAALIILHTAKKTQMMNLDAGIAGHHINLACETEGIGCCWIGFHSELARRFRFVRKASQIPLRHHVLGTLVAGYPKFSYLRVCARKPIKIDYITEQKSS